MGTEAMISSPLGQSAMKMSVRRRKATKRMSSRILVRCGCCDQRVEIYDMEDCDGLLEINGVLGTQEQWAEILTPLLEVKT